jgi:hypothetical protein
VVAALGKTREVPPAKPCCADRRRSQVARRQVDADAFIFSPRSATRANLRAAAASSRRDELREPRRFAASLLSRKLDKRQVTVPDPGIEVPHPEPPHFSRRATDREFAKPRPRNWGAVSSLTMMASPADRLHSRGSRKRTWMAPKPANSGRLLL